MAFTFDEVPEEVKWVLSIQMAYKNGVGMDTLEKCQRIINKHPEWFPADPKEETPTNKQLK